jgi:hypothetical protein
VFNTLELKVEARARENAEVASVREGLKARDGISRLGTVHGQRVRMEPQEPQPYIRGPE